MLIGGRGRPHEGSLHEEEARMSAENEAPVRRYVEEVYDQCKLEIVDELFASDFTLHDPDLPGGTRGPEGIKRIVDMFPDLQVRALLGREGDHTLDRAWRTPGRRGSCPGGHLVSGRTS